MNTSLSIYLSIDPSFVAALLQHARSTRVASKSFACFFDCFFECYLRKEGSEDPGESLEEAPRKSRETLREPLERSGKAPGQCSAGPGCPGRLRERPGGPWELFGERPGDPRDVLGAPRENAGSPWENPGKSRSGRGRASGSVLRAPDERIVRYVKTEAKPQENIGFRSSRRLREGLRTASRRPQELLRGFVERSEGWRCGRRGFEERSQ